MSSFLSQVGSALRAARHRKGASLEQVAAVAGTTRSTLSKWELGRIQGVPLGKLDDYVTEALDCGIELVVRPGAASTASFLEGDDDPHTAAVLARIADVVRRLPTAAHRDQALVAVLTVEQLARTTAQQAASDR